MTEPSKDQLTSESLDPANWEEARATAHQMVDEMVDYLSSIRSRPAWRSVPEDVKAAANEWLREEYSVTGRLLQAEEAVQ